MTTKNKSIIAAATTDSSTWSGQLRDTRMVQNFHLVWLDANIDQVYNDHYRHSITRLQQIVSSINTFIDADECIDFVTDRGEERIIMIISAEFSQILIPTVQDLLQVSCVYIFGENKMQVEECGQEWSKIQGVYTNVTLLCEVLKQATYDCEQNLVSISVVHNTAGVSDSNLDTLHCSFMYTQILKEILLTIDFEQGHIDDFLSYCREQLADNPTQLNNVERLRREYRDHQPIWWYTLNCFLYSMLNRALRFMEVDVIVKMGFFIRDLHNHIVTLHGQQYGAHPVSKSFTVYRGQGLSRTDFDQLKLAHGGLVAFNNFLSTSLNQGTAVRFVRRAIANSDLVGMLFVMQIDPSISTTSFANVNEASCYRGEDEILFSMHSVFRIGEVKRSEDDGRLWKVELTLTGDDDPQLHRLTESIRQETSSKYKGWYRLGKLLLQLDQFEKAEELYAMLLVQSTDEDEKRHVYHQLGLTKNGRGEYAEAVEYYEKSIAILQKALHPSGDDLATSYNNIGGVYDNMGEYSKALSFYGKGLEIDQRNFPANHPSLATSYNNIGMVYNNMGEYSRALSFYGKGLEINENSLPAIHPSLAVAYNNIGMVYDNMGEYSTALSYYHKALGIKQKALPANHPDSATSYINIGVAYDNMGEYSKVLSYYEKAIEIYQNTLRANHPLLTTSYNNIGAVYAKIGEYSKAFSFYEKALEIYQNTLPANHPKLAGSYNNIGEVYCYMDEYSKALSSFNKALAIQQKSLSVNHPLLATSYNNIGEVYRNTGEYSKALSFYNKALEILQKSLPINQPDLATSYNNIGAVYCHMREYSTALSYYGKALEIDEKTLSASHPSLASSYNNIGFVYTNMGEYSNALPYLERALDIFQRSLPADHPNIKNVKQSIQRIKKNCK